MGLTQQEGSVVSLSLSGGHMSLYSYYSFYLREKDGQVLFDVRCWVDNGDANGYSHREIVLENTVAAQEDMDALRVLCERYHLARRRETYQKPKPGSGPFVRDAPTRNLDVRWDNGARLDAGIDFGNLDDLLAFFQALAVRIYETKPRPEGEIVSLPLFNGDHFVR